MDGRATFAIVVAEGEPLTFESVGAALAHATALQPGGRVGVWGFAAQTLTLVLRTGRRSRSTMYVGNVAYRRRVA